MKPFAGARLLAEAVVDPAGTVREVVRVPRAALLAATASLITVALGAATLPRQLSLLHQALAPTGDVARDFHHAAMQHGLLRIVLADRLVPPPTVVLAAILLAWAAEPILALARERRQAIWAVLALGLAPLILQRAGELAVTYLANVGSPPRLGDAVSLPQQFVTGPLLLWRGGGGGGGGGDPPTWLVSVSQRCNLFSLWSAAIWTFGLKGLDGGRLASWHLAVPVLCLVLAGYATWWLAPMASALLLGTP